MDESQAENQTVPETAEKAEAAEEGAHPLNENQGKPPSQIEAENPSEEQIAQEQREMESRAPGGVNTVPSDPRGAEDAGAS